MEKNWERSAKVLGDRLVFNDGTVCPILCKRDLFLGLVFFQVFQSICLHGLLWVTCDGFRS
jgi:hypothetical protein